MLITLIVLLVSIILFIWDRLRVDVVALGVLVALAITGVVTPQEAIAGFGSNALITFAALFIVGGAVFQTGLADILADFILRVAGKSEVRLLVVLMGAVATMSAFISPTGVVALMLPAVLSLARQAKIAPSKLLMPIAFSGLLGGSSTLIGTPPNLLASDALVKAGEASLGFFAFTPPSLIIFGFSLVFMVTIGRHLLPVRQSTQASPLPSPSDLFQLYRLPDNLIRLRVPKESALVGLSLADSHLRESGVNVLRVHHPRERRESLPDGATVFQADDELIVQAEDNAIQQVCARWGLALRADQPITEGDVLTHELGIAEIVLRPRTTLEGESLVSARFGTRFGLEVLELRRADQDFLHGFERMPLKVGDVLLVQGPWQAFIDLKHRHREEFIVLGEKEVIASGVLARRQYAPRMILILLGMVAAILLDNSALVIASLTAALACVLTNCITIDEAYQAIDWRTIILIGGMFPLSTAMQKVGLVTAMVDLQTQALGSGGPMLSLALMFMVSFILTQLLSNTVTALLLAPLAIANAQAIGVHPQAFVVVASLAASMAFMTPIATPANTLVMSAGDYRFGDYAKLGTFYAVLSFVVIMLVVPIMYPL
jgi:di/tricarboxylate transporter